jgi:hypothetical protein
VFRILSAQLATQLASIRSALDQSLPSLNRQLSAAGLPAIVESTAEIKSSTPANAGNAADDDEEEAEKR